MLTGDNPQPRRDTSPEKPYSLPEDRWDNIQPSSSGPLGWSPRRPHGTPSVKPPFPDPSCPHLGSPLRHTACTTPWAWGSRPGLGGAFGGTQSQSSLWGSSISLPGQPPGSPPPLGAAGDSRGLSSPKETDASSHDSCSCVSTFRRIFFSLFHMPGCFMCVSSVRSTCLS